MNIESLDMKVTTKQITEGEIYDSEYWKAGTTATDQLSVPKDINVLMDTTKIIVPYHAVDNAVTEKIIEEVERPDDPTCPDPVEPTSSYTVSFYNGETLLETVDVASGDSAEYTGETPTYQGENPENYVFIGWEPAPTEVHSDMDCYAQFKDITVVDDSEITDDWDTILANIENGTYLAKYSVGNYKPHDLGTEGIVNMQIVGFNVDPLADGTGNAPTTWISKEVLATDHRMNVNRTPSNTPYTEGTGSVGGWKMTEMRTYLKDNIKPLIPFNSSIKEVTKYSLGFGTNGNVLDASDRISTDDVWIPSIAETTGDNSLETNAPYYSSIYPDNNSRKKNRSGSAVIWWLRTGATSGARFNYITTSGTSAGLTPGGADQAHAIALGFCL